MQKLGKQMRALRVELGLTQQDLAAALGCSDATVSDYERGVTMMDAHSLATLKAYFKRQHENRGIPEITKVLA